MLAPRTRRAFATLALASLGMTSTGCAEDPSYVVRWQIVPPGTVPAEAPALTSPKQCTDSGIARVRMTTKQAGLVVDSREYPCFPPEFFELDAVAGGPELAVGDYSVELQPLNHRGANLGSGSQHAVTIGSETPIQLNNARLGATDECQDGVDNDRDGAVDDADRGCRIGALEGDDTFIRTFIVHPKLFDGEVTSCAQIGIENIRVWVDDGLTVEEFLLPCSVNEPQDFIYRLAEGKRLYNLTVEAAGLNKDDEEITVRRVTPPESLSAPVQVDANFGVRDFKESLVAPMGFTVRFLPHPASEFDYGCEITPALELDALELELVDGETPMGALSFVDRDGLPLDGSPRPCVDYDIVTEPLTWSNKETLGADEHRSYAIRARGLSELGETCFDNADQVLVRGVPDVRPTVPTTVDVVVGRPEGATLTRSCADCFADVHCGCDTNNCCDFAVDAFDGLEPTPDGEAERDCQSDDLCPDGLYCGAQDRCVECEQASECAAGQTCSAGFCRCDINAPSTCPNGQACGPDLRCHEGAPGDPCFANTCDGLTKCHPVLATCHCNNNGDCLGGVCNTDTNACECETDAHCLIDGEVCDPVTRACVTGCVDDDECGPDEACSLNNACVAAQCTSNGDCGGGEVCSANHSCTSGQAGTACTNDTQCADSSYCDLTSFRCRDGALFDACDPNADGCNDGLSCVGDGVCSDGALGRPCSGSSCADGLFCGADQLCHDGTLGDPCASDGECPGAGLYCGPNGVCHDGTLGDGCVTDEDCGDPDLYCEPVPNPGGETYARCQPFGTCKP